MVGSSTGRQMDQRNVGGMSERNRYLMNGKKEDDRRAHKRKKCGCRKPS